MLGVFKKFSNNLNSIFKSKTLDAESIEELESLLYTADFGTETVEKIIEAIEKNLKKQAKAITQTRSSLQKQLSKNN